MLNMVIRWVLFALALLLIAWLVPGIQVAGFVPALIAALVIGLINIFVRPILGALTLPINIATLGIFSFILNALLLWLSAAIVPGFNIDGFLPALIGSILLTILSVIINSTTGKHETPAYRH